MKKLGFVFGIVVIVLALLYIGYVAGVSHRALGDLYSIPTIDKALTDAGTKALIIEQLDSGKVEDARKHLELQLDGDIMTVDALLDSSDARTRNLAQKVFARIASYRVAHPRPPTDPTIPAILERAKQPPSK